MALSDENFPQVRASTFIARHAALEKKPMEQSLTKLRLQTHAWKKHIERMHLDDRERFIDWLSRALSPQEMALLIDAEVDRRSLWEIYLNEHYGP